MVQIRAAYIFDTLSDVRFVDGFHRTFEELTLVVPEHLGALTTNPTSQSVPTVRLKGGRAGFILKAASWLVKNKNRYDVIFALDNVSAAAAANLSRLITRRPVILMLGRPTMEYFKCKRGQMPALRYWLSLILLKLIVWPNERLSSANAPISKYVRSKTGGRIKELVPYYGVDTRAFAQRWSKAEARNKLDLDEHRQMVFCRSRIAPEKDPQTFLEAISLLRAEGRDPVVLYVGGEFKEFEELAARYKVPVVTRDHVHPLDELPMYYVAADVAVQTSRSEGLGLSPLEALACGVAVVASATGGLHETIKPNKTGLLAPVGDPLVTADCIRWILDHPAEAADMAANGRKMVEAEYSTDVAFSRWRELAEKVTRLG